MNGRQGRREGEGWRDEGGEGRRGSRASMRRDEIERERKREGHVE